MRPTQRHLVSSGKGREWQRGRKGELCKMLAGLQGAEMWLCMGCAENNSLHRHVPHGCMIRLFAVPASTQQASVISHHPKNRSPETAAIGHQPSGRSAWQQRQCSSYDAVTLHYSGAHAVRTDARNACTQVLCRRMRVLDHTCSCTKRVSGFLYQAPQKQAQCSHRMYLHTHSAHVGRTRTRLVLTTY